ncbi:ATP-binding protein [Tistrella mobilis]|uniref:HAMP domain-containing sensor histidine kinase n=1 Tax=Tistrella mobilis TaxID=171437 RepID=UPI003555C23F
MTMPVLAALRGRLFWKILFGFGLTFFLMVQTLWVAIQLFDDPPRPIVHLFEDRLAPVELASAAAVLESGGLPALRRLIAAWPESERAGLVVRPADHGTPAASVVIRRDEVLIRSVTAPDGSVWQLSRDLSDLRMPPRPGGPFRLPPEIIMLGVGGGLVFSTALARYLIRPILRLRRGFDDLAGGDLAVRLGPAMGRRRDELADLARDFDVMAARLEQTVAARDRLLHDVSHELRSPLARLHMAVGLVRQSPDRVAVTLDRLELETARLDTLVGELLTLSRVENDAPRREDYFDLHGLVASVVADARFEAGPAGVTVESHVTPAASLTGGAMLIKGSAELMRRAVENIIRNALKFSPEGGAVTVAVDIDERGRRHVLKVRDRGPGVPPEMLASIFEPFVRGPDGSRNQGYGLGLAIARRTVEAHGGRIIAANRSTGGLEMTVTLPWTMTA